MGNEDEKIINLEDHRKPTLIIRSSKNVGISKTFSRCGLKKTSERVLRYENAAAFLYGDEHTEGAMEI